MVSGFLTCHPSRTYKCGIVGLKVVMVSGVSDMPLCQMDIEVWQCEIVDCCGLLELCLDNTSRFSEREEKASFFAVLYTKPRVQADSTWTPGTPCGLQGLHADSRQSPHKIKTRCRSAWTVHVESTWSPHLVHTMFFSMDSPLDL